LPRQVRLFALDCWKSSSRFSREYEPIALSNGFWPGTKKKPKDPTTREKFNTYRSADYKEQVIVDLLMRVTAVTVETVSIVRAMKTVKR
jgi:hypothetical protein